MIDHFIYGYGVLAATIPIGMIDLAVAFLLEQYQCHTWIELIEVVSGASGHFIYGYGVWLGARVAQQAAFDSRTTGSHHFYSC